MKKMEAKNQTANSLPGRLVTVEGIEGAGKTTVVDFIAGQIAANQFSCVCTREPGGTRMAESIRQILLDPGQEPMQSVTELLLMFAARGQHIAEVIAPALQAGKWVLSDRYVDASYAYQGAGRGLELQRIHMLDEWVVGVIQPDITFLLDVSPEIGLARAKNRGPHDRIEQERLDFFARVREGYLARAAACPERIRVIDANQTPGLVQNEISAHLTGYFKSFFDGRGKA